MFDIEDRNYVVAIPADRWAQHACPFEDLPRYCLPPFRLLVKVWEAMRENFYTRRYEDQSAPGDPTKTKYAS